MSGHLEEIQRGRIIVDIGMSREDRRVLDNAARRGEIKKWRGYWYPEAGAPWGIGSRKTCFGLLNPYETSK